MVWLSYVQLLQQANPHSLILSRYTLPRHSNLRVPSIKRIQTKILLCFSGALMTRMSCVKYFQYCIIVPDYRSVSVALF